MWNYKEWFSLIELLWMVSFNLKGDMLFFLLKEKYNF